MFSFIDKKKSLLPILLGFTIVFSLYLSYYLFLYEVGIFCATSGDWGELIWCSSEAGTFFPLPRESGHEAALSYANSLIDYIIYNLLIQTSLIYFLFICSWLITIVFCYYTFSVYKNNQKV